VSGVIGIALSSCALSSATRSRTDLAPTNGEISLDGAHHAIVWLETHIRSSSNINSYLQVTLSLLSAFASGRFAFGEGPFKRFDGSKPVYKKYKKFTTAGNEYGNSTSIASVVSGLSKA